MTFTLIISGKEMTVEPLMERMPGGGWKCRCKEKVDGLHDAYQHIRDQHAGDPVMDPAGNIYDTRALCLDDLRAGGLI